MTLRAALILAGLLAFAFTALIWPYTREGWILLGLLSLGAFSVILLPFVREDDG
ncbi:MAG: hypothetical protein AAGG09_07860 [Pseudomonadota bacterium]